MIPSANELLYFIELANTLNFSRASERIGINQPSLSAAIKRLEQAMNAELFIRDKHKVILTQAGKNLLLHAKQLVQLWETTKANCLASQGEVQGNIILGCHPSVGMYLLPKFLPALLTKYNKLEIRLKHDLSRKIAEEIINIMVDVGIVVNPVKHPDLIIKKLFNDEVTCWQSKSFSMKSIPADERIIICDPELKQTQFVLKNIHKKGIKYKRILTTNNLEVVANLTAAGAGIGILPSGVANSVQHAKLHRLSNAPVYHDEVCLVYRHENRNVKAVQVVVEAIKSIKL